MKYARKRWLKLIALCLGLTPPAWGQAVIFPDDPTESDGAIVISDEAASVRLKTFDENVSGSVVASEELPQDPFQFQPPPAFASRTPEQVMGPVQPVFPEATSGAVGFASLSSLNEIKWRMGRVNMDQYGYNGGYTNLNAFVPLFVESDRSLFWVNPRANITDYGRGAASLGVGRRVYVPEEDRVYGASFWWDFDDGHAASYNQLGGSFESIGRYFSLRGNFTLPVGQKTATYRFQNGSPQFVGSNIAVLQTFTRENAYQQYDFEVATPMPGLGQYGLDLGVGMYFLTGSNAPDATGVSVRTEAQVTEDFWINGVYTHDSVFDSLFSINFELTMPDGMPSRWFRRNPVSDSLTASVRRRYRVPVGLTNDSRTVLATDDNGNVINVAFIDPNLSAAGNGSIETPFMSVADYMDEMNRDQYGLIFVFRRTDATDTNLNTTITLLDDQKLVGDVDLPEDQRPRVTVNVAGTRQSIALPGRTGTLDGSTPILSNSGAAGMDVVTLANGNEVVGFTIDGGDTASGIAGAGIDGFYIHDNTIQNSVNAISITSDTTGVRNSAIDDYGIIEGNTLLGNGFNSNNGLYIDHTAGTLDLLVNNNQITGFLGEDANENGVLNTGEDNNGNGVLDAGYGIQVIASGGTINADNFLIEEPEEGEEEERRTGFFNNTVGSVTLIDDTVLSGNETGIQLTAQDTGTFNVALFDNTIFGNVGTIESDSDLTGAGLSALAVDGGTLTVTAASRNTISENAGDGVLLVARDGGTLTVPAPEDLNQNGILDTTEDLNGNGVLDPDEDLDEDGVLDLDEDLNGNGVLDFGLFGNTITDNDNNGIRVLADNADMDVNIGAIGLTPNIISGNGRVETTANVSEAIGSGVLLTTLNGGTMVGSIDGNTISNNYEAGIKIAPDAGTVNLNSISGNTITNNGSNLPTGLDGGDAIVFAPSNGGSFSVGQFTGNIISGNRGAIIRVGGTGGIIDLGVIEDTVFDRTQAGTTGILFDATDATITGTLRNNIFIGSETNEDLSFGVGGEIRGGTLDLTIEDNIFVTNSGAGIGLILAASDTRTGPGTPLVGDATEAKVVITGNAFLNTLEGDDPRFDGAGISIQLEGYENDPLLGQNDIDDDGGADGPLVPSPDGSDVTDEVQPGVVMEGIIAGNAIGSLEEVTISDSRLSAPITLDPLESGNAGPGIDIRLKGDAQIGDLAGVGSAIDDPNIDGLIIGTDDSLPYTGNLIANNQLDGIRVRREDNALIDNFKISRNLIQNNLEDGIDITASNNGQPYGVEEILDFTIVENQILNNGFLTDGTQGSAGRGVQLRANAAAVMQVDIDSNIISGNRMSGIEARTFTDTHLFIGGGRDDIVHVAGGEDGVIYGTWQLNTITNNGFLSNEDTNRNGILDAGEDIAVIDVDDDGIPDVGNGVLDVVTEGHGIALGRIDIVDPDNEGGVLEGFNNGGVLVPAGENSDADGHPILTISENRIASNAEDGIHIYLDKSPTFSVQSEEPRTSRIEILSNDILDNGEDGFNIHNPISSIVEVDFNDNLVRGNGLYSELFQITQAHGNAAESNIVNVVGDGMEIVTANGAQTTLNAANNRIIENNGRGVNIFTSGYANLIADFERNDISSNTREGFYLVNADLEVIVQGVTGLPAGTPFSGYTTDTWLADFDSNHEMFTYGHFGAGNLGYAGNTVPAVIAPFMVDWVQNVIGGAPVTDLTFTSNTVDNNGSVVPDADGEDPYSTVGGFVIRVGSTTQDQFSYLNGFPSVPEPGLAGGVRALVTDNRMSGNYGRDVYFDGFIGTEPPNVTIVPDPLIRFDLVFENNRGGSLDVDNFDAYYNNTTPTLPGGQNNTRPTPQYSGNQDVPRPAWRDIGLDGNGLLLPGFGPNTLRIEADGAAINAFGNNIGNNTFNLIYGDFNSFFWENAEPDGTLLPVPPFPAGY